MSQPSTLAQSPPNCSRSKPVFGARPLTGAARARRARCPDGRGAPPRRRPAEAPRAGAAAGEHGGREQDGQSAHPGDPPSRSGGGAGARTPAAAARTPRRWAARYRRACPRREDFSIVTVTVTPRRPAAAAHAFSSPSCVDPPGAAAGHLRLDLVTEPPERPVEPPTTNLLHTRPRGTRRAGASSFRCCPVRVPVRRRRAPEPRDAGQRDIGAQPGGGSIPPMTPPTSTSSTRPPPTPRASAAGDVAAQGLRRDRHRHTPPPRRPAHAFSSPSSSDPRCSGRAPTTRPGDLNRGPPRSAGGRAPRRRTLLYTRPRGTRRPGASSFRARASSPAGGVRRGGR